MQLGGEPRSPVQFCAISLLSSLFFVILLAFSGSLVLPFQSSSQEVKALCFSFLPGSSCSCICVQDYIAGGQRDKKAMVENRLVDMEAARGRGAGGVGMGWDELRELR